MMPLVELLVGAVPQHAHTAAAAVGLAGVLAGLVLWLLGSRFSRSLVTLGMVSVGAWIGLQLPRWSSLPVGGWATATGAALVLGVSGYVLHRLWTGIGLSLLAGVWAGIFVATAYGLGDAMSLKPPQSSTDIWQYLQQVWNILPADSRRIGSLACGLAMCSGLGIAILWSRMAGFLFYSLLGLTLVVILGAVAVELVRPQLLEAVPSQRTTQLGAMVGLVLFGALAQWRIAPKMAAATPPEPKKEQ